MKPVKPQVQRFIVRAKPAANHRKYRPWETASLVVFIGEGDCATALFRLDAVLRTHRWELLAFEEKGTLVEQRVREIGGDVWAAYQTAQTRGDYLVELPEHFGAGNHRPPLAPPRINEHFVDEMIRRGGGRRLTDAERGGDGDENADYLLDDFIIELKEIREEPLGKEERQHKLAALFTPYFPNDSEVPLDPSVLTQADTLAFYEIIGGPIQRAVKKAAKQIRATRDRLGLASSRGAVILVNSGSYTLIHERFHVLGEFYAHKDTRQIEEVASIVQGFTTNGFDSCFSGQFFPIGSRTPLAEKLATSFSEQMDVLMNEWGHSGFIQPEDAMEPPLPIQFIADGRVFAWVPGFPPRTWLGENPDGAAEVSL